MTLLLFPTTMEEWVEATVSFLLAFFPLVDSLTSSAKKKRSPPEQVNMYPVVQTKMDEYIC